MDHAFGIPENHQHHFFHIAVFRHFRGMWVILLQPSRSAPAHQGLVAAEPGLVSGYDTSLECWSMSESCQKVMCHPFSSVTLCLS